MSDQVGDIGSQILAANYKFDQPKNEILPNTEKEKKDENNFQLFLTEYKNTLLVIGLVAVGYYLYKKNK